MIIDEVKKVCVVGGGQMGRQIAMNAALHGFEAGVTDTSESARASMAQWADEYLAGRVAKGRLTQEQADAAAVRFRVTDTLEAACEGASLAIEAVIEDRIVKSEVLGKISRLVSPDAVIATNSSYMVSSLFREAVTKPERLANAHYFHPALVMNLVEIVRGEHTSDETVSFLAAYAERTGKTPVILAKETEGFVVTRILRAIKEEAYALLEQGVCTVEGIDTACELGLNHPMGPFKLEDFSGIDVKYHSNKRRRQETGKKPPGYDIVKRKYEAGEWGRKTGKGFYVY